jgi:hypothetical protein
VSKEIIKMNIVKKFKNSKPKSKAKQPPLKAFLVATQKKRENLEKNIRRKGNKLILISIGGNKNSLNHLIK